ncbi:DUF302 domain-containing protein [Roseibium sediminicola]|uniref:DUF302 domain-containing protein n=1 Tax=Roseibium sediminicola TaxID=2933272 RepID=A0ABT0GWF5_9HYPH|nr:DUF302 domain-containing protein [Roseibium sp. CAU 1639]MCK7613776.1 DUF302 domain-containing protein [Roseibium sp. CAU 1639]
MRFLVFCVVMAFAVSGLARAGSLPDREGWQVVPTDKAFQALVEDLKAAVKADKMGLITQASASAGAKGRGLTIPGNMVIGVYRNDYAVRMLEASVAAGIEAPIRFYVTDNGDGTATLSWKMPSFVFAPYMDEGGEALAELATELDLMFLSIAEGAVAAK